jgi:hypothetical protein
MFHQIFLVIKNYFDFEIVTRFEVKEIKINNKISNSNALDFFLKKPFYDLMEIYPEMKQEVHLRRNPQKILQKYSIKKWTSSEKSLSH